MTAIVSPLPQFFDLDGSPLSAGYVYIGTANGNPETSPVTAYWDAALTQPAAQPLRTSAGAIVRGGTAAPVYVGSAYSMTVRNASGEQVNYAASSYGYDNAAAFALSLASTTAGNGSALVGHSFALNYAVATIGAALNDISLNVSQFPWLAALDGTTDDTAAIQACITFAPNGSTILIPGVAKCSSQILVTGKTGLTLKGGGTSKLLFTDGAYIGLLFDSNSQHCKIENLRIWGTNTTAPTITLVKATGASAYLTVDDCNFAYASIAFLAAATYVVKLRGNRYSNCDTYVKAIATEGGTADLLMQGETFGTSLIGTNALVDLQFVYARLNGCYFETESRVKHSVHLRDISGNPELIYAIGGATQFFQSGSIYVDGEANLVMSGCTSQRSYNSAGLYFIRIAASANATITGNMLSMNTLIAGLAGISCSGHATVTGNTIRLFAKGAAFAAGICDANTFIDCTVGTDTGVGSTAVVGNTNSFINCGTDISNPSTTSTAPRAITVTLTGCTTAPTGAARYEADKGVVTLTLPAISATSNSTACTITGLSAAITPAIDVFGSMVLVLDNGVQSAEQVAISTGGVVSLYKNGSLTGFTAAGTKGVRECVITYRLRNV